MRWPILAGLGLLASPTPALADDPLYACAKVAPDAKLTIQFTPDLTLRDLGAWLTGFTCKSVVYDTEAAARAPKLALIAPSSVTPRQAVQLFVDTVQKAGLAVTDKHDTFVVSLDPAAQRRCPGRPSAPLRSSAAGACVRSAADARMALSFKPDSTLDDLALWITGVTCKRVTFDPSIAAQATTVSLIVSAQVTPKQAARLFVDAVESTGLVVTEKTDGFDVKPGPRWAHCAAAARTPAPPAPGSGVVPAPPPPPSPVPPPAPDPDDLDAVFDAGIRKIDDTHYELKRAVLDKMLTNPMAIAKGARIVPSMRNGQPNGFKLYAIRQGSLFPRIGLMNGDTLLAINGRRLDSADKALEVYVAIRDARQLELLLERNGAPLTITIKITR
jgi:hypothetical protein